MNLISVLPHDEYEDSTREGRVISGGSDAPTPTRSWPCYVTKGHHDIGNEIRKKHEVIMAPRRNRLPSFSAFYAHQHDLMPAIKRQKGGKEMLFVTNLIVNFQFEEHSLAGLSSSPHAWEWEIPSSLHTRFLNQVLGMPSPQKWC